MSDVNPPESLQSITNRLDKFIEDENALNNDNLPITHLQNLNFKQKVSDVGRVLYSSWQQEGATGKATLVGAAATQIYERSRIPEIIAPPIAVEVFNSTNGSTFKTGLVLGGLVMGQQLVIGSVWAETLSRFNNVTTAITTHFPKTSELAEDIGPAKNRKWYSNIREGLSGFFTYGTTPFLIAQKTYQPELTRKEAHITAARISASIGIVGLVFGKTITEIVQEVPAEYQDDIVNVIGKPYLWMGLAALYEIPRFAKKRLDRKKLV
ncbi:MAG: hypothetical protein WCJ60_02015 [bacterium]